jgi:hypothetical protein
MKRRRRTGERTATPAGDRAASGEALADWPRRGSGLAARRRFWAAQFGLSEAQVAWLPGQRRFARILGRLAPDWERGHDSGGPFLGREFPLDRGEALFALNVLAPLLQRVDTPSYYALTLDTGGGLAVRLIDDEAAAVSFDDAWTARLVDEAMAHARRKRSPLRRLLRRWRCRLGLGPPKLTLEVLAAGLAERRGWGLQEPDQGRRALFQGYLFGTERSAILFANAAAALLGHLWEGVEAQVTLAGRTAVVILFAPLRAWPPRELLDAADWIDEAAAELGGAIEALDAALSRAGGAT